MDAHDTEHTETHDIDSSNQNMTGLWYASIQDRSNTGYETQPHALPHAASINTSAVYTDDNKLCDNNGLNKFVYNYVLDEDSAGKNHDNYKVVGDDTMLNSDVDSITEHKNIDHTNETTVTGNFVAAPNIQQEFLEFQCTECGDFFMSYEHFKVHIENHTQQGEESMGEEPKFEVNQDLAGFNCLECGRYFSRKYHIKRHVKMHEKTKDKRKTTATVVSRIECGKVYRRLSNIINCPESGNKKQTNRHERTRKKQNVKTRKKNGRNILHGAESNYVSVEDKRVTVEKAKICDNLGSCPIKNEAYECENDDDYVACGNITEDVDSDATEIQESSNSDSMQQQRDEQELVQQEVKQETESCLFSTELDTSTKSLKPAMSTVSPDLYVSVGGGKFACNICGKLFQRLHRMKRHQECHERRAIKEAQRVERLAAEKLNPGKRKRKLVDVNCDICGQYFSRMDHLKRHKLIHQSDRVRKTPTNADADGETRAPYKCEKCSRSFSTLAFFDRHKKTHMFKCEFCKAAYETKEELQSHMVIHKEEKPNVCEICGKQFHLRKQLHKHKELHKYQDPDVLSFVCKTCGIAFRTKRILQRHEADHTGRTFMCQVCGKAFKVRCDLTHHSKIHFGVRKHICSVCGKGFLRDKDLRRHMLTHRR